MNYKVVSTIIIGSVLLLSGCSSKERVPVSQSQRDYPLVRHRPDVNNAYRKDIPKLADVTRPSIVNKPVKSGYGKYKNYPVSVEFVEGRLLSYNKKLEKWREYDEQSSVLNLDRRETEQMVGCFRDLQRIANGYARLRDMLVAGEDTTMLRTMTLEAIQGIQEDDVLLLESFCGRLLDTEQSVTTFGRSDIEENLGQLEAIIGQSYQNREYEQVVQSWLEIPEEKVSQVTIEAKLMYGKSLMYLHQEQKAAAVYEQIIVDIDKKEKEATDVLMLHRVLANLYVAGRNYSAAAGQYREIAAKYYEVLQVKEWSDLQQKILNKSKVGGGELNEYSAIVRNYMGYIPSQDGYIPVWQAEKFMHDYPESPTLTNVDLLKSDMYLKAELWFNSLIGDIDELRTQQQYQDGLILIGTIPQDIITPEQIQLVEKKRNELLRAEEVVQEKLKLEKLRLSKDRWTQVLALVDSKSYDEAIAQLNLIVDADYSDKVARKIAEVSLLAARKNRQQAAMLFSRASKTKDAEVKKQLLVESHQLLLLIVLKYPDTRIVDKVMGNMKRVELVMDELDPTLVEWSRMAVEEKLMRRDSQVEKPSNIEDGFERQSTSQLNVKEFVTEGNSLNLDRER